MRLAELCAVPASDVALSMAEAGELLSVSAAIRTASDEAAAAAVATLTQRTQPDAFDPTRFAMIRGRVLKPLEALLPAMAERNALLEAAPVWMGDDAEGHDEDEGDERVREASGRVAREECSSLGRDATRYSGRRDLEYREANVDDEGDGRECEVRGKAVALVGDRADLGGGEDEGRSVRRADRSLAHRRDCGQRRRRGIHA